VRGSGVHGQLEWAAPNVHTVIQYADKVDTSLGRAIRVVVLATVTGDAVHLQSRRLSDGVQHRM